MNIPNDEYMSRIFGSSYGGDTGHRGLDGLGFNTANDMLNNLRNTLDEENSIYSDELDDQEEY